MTRDVGGEGVSWIMICADCGEPAEHVCGACGAEPRLGGRYALLAPLGEGATGTTWRAATPDGRVVAVKQVDLRRARSEKARALVQREARVLAQLRHPGIPAFVEAFEVGVGRRRSLCIVQELVEGLPLDRWAEAERRGVDEIVAVLAALCEVLDYLHGLAPPVVHRDLKPANVLVRGDGSVALVDFGAVRDALRDTEGGGSTVAGTFGYMAPEQLVGDARPATDLYGLGALAVRLLTGLEPHTLQGWDRALRWHAHADVPEAVAAVVDALLEPDVARRLSSARAARAALLGTAELPARRLASEPAWRRLALGELAVHTLVASVAAGGLTLAVTTAATLAGTAATPAVSAAVQPIAYVPEPPEVIVDPQLGYLTETWSGDPKVRRCFLEHSETREWTVDVPVRLLPTRRIEVGVANTLLEACIYTRVQEMGLWGPTVEAPWQTHVPVLRSW